MTKSTISLNAFFKNSFLARIKITVVVFVVECGRLKYSDICLYRGYQTALSTLSQVSTVQLKRRFQATGNHGFTHALMGNFAGYTHFRPKLVSNITINCKMVGRLNWLSTTS